MARVGAPRQRRARGEDTGCARDPRPRRGLRRAASRPCRARAPSGRPCASRARRARAGVAAVPASSSRDRRADQGRRGPDSGAVRVQLSADASRVLKGDSSLQKRLKFIEDVLAAAQQQTPTLFMPELLGCDIVAYGDRVRDDLRNRVAHSAPGSETYARSLLHGFREPGVVNRLWRPQCGVSSTSQFHVSLLRAANFRHQRGSVLRRQFLVGCESSEGHNERHIPTHSISRTS